jgi:putative transposase
VFDIFGNIRKASVCEPLKVTQKEALNGTLRKLKHTKWECKYHVVWIPKCRKKVLYGQLRKDLGPILRKLALQKESEVVEGKLKVDHVHMVVSIPPKYSVAQVIGYMKGKSAIWVAGQRGRIGTFWVRTSGLAAIVFQRLA